MGRATPLRAVRCRFLARVFSRAQRMISFLQRWLVTTVAVLVAANVVPGIDYDSLAGLAVASLLLGVLNAFVRPVMMLLSLPLIALTLGLFVLIVNALLLYAVGHVVRSFHVSGFGAAFWGGLVISIVSFAISILTGRTKGRIKWLPRRTMNRSRRPPEGGGPVIDV